LYQKGADKHGYRTVAFTFILWLELNSLDSTIRDNIWKETPGDFKFPAGFADGGGDGFLISVFSSKLLSFIYDNGRVVLTN